jgi:hypothetical protein
MRGSVANGSNPPFFKDSMCGRNAPVPRVKTRKNGLFSTFATLPHIPPRRVRLTNNISKHLYSLCETDLQPITAGNRHYFLMVEPN